MPPKCKKKEQQYARATCNQSYTSEIGNFNTGFLQWDVDSLAVCGDLWAQQQVLKDNVCMVCEMKDRAQDMHDGTNSKA